MKIKNVITSNNFKDANKIGEITTINFLDYYFNENGNEIENKVKFADRYIEEVSVTGRELTINQLWDEIDERKIPARYFEGFDEHNNQPIGELVNTVELVTYTTV